MARTRAEVIDSVQGIGKEASALFDLVAKKAQKKGKKQNLTDAEIRRIKRLIEAADKTKEEAGKLAKARREKEVAELAERIEGLKGSLGVPNLPAEYRKFTEDRIRLLSGELVDKRARLSLDFGGLLSKQELEGIKTTLLEAKQAVARRSRAAGFAKTLLQISELAFGIVKKVGRP